MRKAIHNVNGGLAVVSQLICGYMIKLELGASHALLFPPVQPHLNPAAMPLLVLTGFDKKFKLHLLELSHAENKVSWRNFISKRLANLRNTKG